MLRICILDPPETMLLTNLDMQTAIVIDNYEARSGILTNLNI